MNIRHLSAAAAGAAIAAYAAFTLAPAGAMTAATPSPGDLIKGTSFPAVYYYSANGKRYVFPTERTFRSWYVDFSGVKTFSDTTIASIGIGGNATYRPGARMVKVTTDPKVYVVGRGGLLRWVTQESIAASYYGSDWNKKIDDVPDPFFVNYTVGADIDAVADFSPATETATATTIDVDKGITTPTVQPKTVDVEYTTSGFSPTTVTVKAGDTVRWTNTTNVPLSLRSNPHPTHTSYPSFIGEADSGHQFSFTFTSAITFGYHNHNSPQLEGTITVNP